MDWSTPIATLSGIGNVYAKRLDLLNISTLGDLICHFPSRYEDYSTIVPLSNLPIDEPVTVIGTLTQITNTYTRNRKTMQKAILTDGSGSVEIVWFNQPFIATTLHEGTTIALSGKAQAQRNIKQFISPEYEILKNGKSPIHTARLVPVYPLTAGISSKWLRSRIALLLTNETLTQDHLPESIRLKQELPSLHLALNEIHFPHTQESIVQARKRLAFDELFFTYLRGAFSRLTWRKKKTHARFTVPATYIEKTISQLPFSLTDSQKNALSEIFSDISRTTPMNRLLQGDVGSGKTIVAALAAVTAAKNGFQSVIMAPTEILAKQHYETFSHLFSQDNLTVQLHTSSTKNSLKTQTQLPDIVIGTHAVLFNEELFQNVGLVIIDEQHRFGVSQRAQLRNYETAPHVLTMTATPIPRTIMLSVYGDLDVSTLSHMPQGRIPIKTRVVESVNRAKAYTWILSKIIQTTPHQQAFIVCPFIEPSESNTTVKAVTEEFTKLTAIFPTLKLGLLHGKLSSKKKDEVLSEFRAGAFDILVCTPVVEVGIDIPNATIMVVEAAERFGLAQLHQLRGRVGRRGQQAYCLLFTSTDVSTETSRLRAMEKTHLGTELAELDLKIRGPGLLFGTQQHGRTVFKIAGHEDFAQLPEIKVRIQAILNQDPSLSTHPLLKARAISSTIPMVTPD